VVICLECSADLHIAQLMPLALTVSCSSKIQIGFTFLVPAHLGSPGQRAVKRVCVCVCVCGYEGLFAAHELNETETESRTGRCSQHMPSNGAVHIMPSEHQPS